MEPTRDELRSEINDGARLTTTATTSATARQSMVWFGAMQPRTIASSWYGLELCNHGQSPVHRLVWSYATTEGYNR